MKTANLNGVTVFAGGHLPVSEIKEGQVWTTGFSEVTIRKTLEKFVFYEGDHIRPAFKTAGAFQMKYFLKVQ